MMRMLHSSVATIPAMAASTATMIFEQQLSITGTPISIIVATISDVSNNQLNHTVYMLMFLFITHIYV
jgi:hypothetical protein